MNFVVIRVRGHQVRKFSLLHSQIAFLASIPLAISVCMIIFSCFQKKICTPKAIFEGRRKWQDELCGHPSEGSSGQKIFTSAFSNSIFSIHTLSYKCVYDNFQLFSKKNLHTQGNFRRSPKMAR